MGSVPSDITGLPVIIPTITLGRAWAHDLAPKLFAAKDAGFTGIEVFWEDLIYEAKKYVSPEQAADSSELEMNEEAMLKAAHYCRQLCDKYGLSVFVLQPFSNFDGLLDEGEHEAMIAKLRMFFKVAKVLKTDMIQVPTQMDAVGTTGDIDKLVADLMEIGWLGLKEDLPIRFAYEALSWGTHIDLWQQAWEIVTRVNLPNVGTVLDTYHILGRVYGDPTSSTGIRADGASTLAGSLQEMASIGQKLNEKLFTFNSRTPSAYTHLSRRRTRIGTRQ